MKEVLDCRGMDCPLPMLKVINKVNTCSKGTVLEVYSDCASFPEDIKRWSEKAQTPIISLIDSNGYVAASLQL